jgi:hypothetical protein
MGEEGMTKKKKMRGKLSGAGAYTNCVALDKAREEQVGEKLHST